jgi:hypothetical protein
VGVEKCAIQEKKLRSSLDKGHFVVYIRGSINAVN